MANRYEEARDGDVVEYKLLGQYDGQLVMNTFHYLVSGVMGGTGVMMNAVRQALDTLIWNNGGAAQLSDLLVIDFEMPTTSAQVVHPLRLPQWPGTPTTLIGARDTAGLPSGVSVVLRRHGPVANRKNQGRIYVGGIAAEDVLNSEVQAPAITDFAAVAATLVDTTTANDGVAECILQPIIWSAANPTTDRPAVIGIADRIVRYQRRREVGVGQ